MALAVNSEMASNTGFGVGSTSTITSPQTFSFTNTSGTLLYVFASLGVNAGATTSFGTVSYNGVSMTNLLEQTSPSGASRIGLFRLLSPATGANTVSVGFSMSGSANYAVIAGAISFTGNDQSTPEVQSTGANGSGTIPTVSLSGVASGNITIAGVAGGSTLSAGASNPQTLSWSKNINTFSQGGNGRSTRSSATGSVTHDYSMSASDSWFTIMLEVAAASAIPPHPMVVDTAVDRAGSW